MHYRPPEHYLGVTASLKPELRIFRPAVLSFFARSSLSSIEDPCQRIADPNAVRMFGKVKVH
jgi:hypothetical protein